MLTVWGWSEEYIGIYEKGMPLNRSSMLLPSEVLPGNCCWGSALL